LLVAADQAPLETKTLPDGSVFVRDARGTAHLMRVAPGILYWECTGFLSTRFYEPMAAVAQHEMDVTGRLSMFVYGWDLRSVETGFREAWTLWFKANRQHFQMRLLVRTKLMEMAASLANLFTGMSVIKTFSDPASWERACAQDHPGFSRTFRAAG
jgi:hypothetical protein